LNLFLKVYLFIISYQIKILTMNENRKERLIKDKSKISRKGLLFLKDIHIINLNTDRFFQSVVQKESFLKDIDKLEIATLQEKLRNNVGGGRFAIVNMTNEFLYFEGRNKSGILY